MNDAIQKAEEAITLEYIKLVTEWIFFGDNQAAMNDLWTVVNNYVATIPEEKSGAFSEMVKEIVDKKTSGLGQNDIKIINDKGLQLLKTLQVNEENK